MKSILKSTPTFAGHLLRKFDWYFIVFSGVFLLSCKNSPTLPVDSQVQAITGQTQFEQLPESFKAFYFKFHEDSLFQMEHIVFPLEMCIRDSTKAQSIGKVNILKNQPHAGKYYESCSDIQSFDFLLLK